MARKGVGSIFRKMISRRHFHIGSWVATLLLLPYLAGCDSKEAQAVVVPPTQVTVSQPLQQEVRDFCRIHRKYGARILANR